MKAKIMWQIVRDTGEDRLRKGGEEMYQNRPKAPSSIQMRKMGLKVQIPEEGSGIMIYLMIETVAANLLGGVIDL